ncbi:MAG: hypothetical protein PHC80_09195 [Eubacteriales bacterium]|nr:hypothetical protein [Eubacteriales bacterium]
MNFVHASSKTIDDSALQADYAQVQPLFKVRLGNRCLYFPRLLKTAYVPYESISKAFMRIKTAVSRVCCGTAEFKDYSLILCEGDAEIAEIMLDSEEKGKRILSALDDRGVSVGKNA